MRPVLKRAGSVKQMGTDMLESPVSAYVANRIEGAIDVADKYVEKYLPSEDQVDGKWSQNCVIVLLKVHKWSAVWERNKS